MSYEQVRLIVLLGFSASQDMLLNWMSQRGLMEKDEWKNLGLANLDKNVVPAASAGNATPISEMPTDKKF